jgi:hypothetical protein
MHAEMRHGKREGDGKRLKQFTGNAESLTNGLQPGPGRIAHFNEEELA